MKRIREVNSVKTTIVNAIVVTMDPEHRVFDRGFVSFEKGRILAAGPMEERDPEKAGEVIDGRGGILMPGMVNVHCHMGMVPFRGLGDDCRDRLRVFLLPMEQKAMDGELVYRSTRYAAAELLLSGVTTVLDMYYFEEMAAQAMDEMGIRGIAGETIMEEPTCDAKTPREALAYAEALMKRYENHPRIRACAAPHGTSTCSEETLRAAHALDRKYGAPFTLHTAEMDYEMAYFRDHYQMTPAQFLDSIGVLDKGTLAAHCIHMTEEDLALFARRGVGAGHCIGSNTKAAKGVSPVSRMAELGIAVGLGTDGPASGNTLDIITQMRLFADFHKNETRNRGAFPAETIVELATMGGARALGMEDQIGSIEPGKRADLVLVETGSVNMFPVYEPCSALVYSANPSNVEAVFVEGERLVWEKKLTRQDLGTLRRELAEKMDGTEFGRIRRFGEEAAENERLEMGF